MPYGIVTHLSLLYNSKVKIDTSGVIQLVIKSLRLKYFSEVKHEKVNLGLVNTGSTSQG